MGKNINFADTPLVKGGDLLIGNRIPRDYFVTSGTGESDLTIHAGSYHLALKSAKIEMCNILCYSSILPRIANEIKRPSYLKHGSVMECILSTCNANKGERATAGIIYGWLYDKKTGSKYGGLVVEINGKYEVAEIKTMLDASLNELYYNGFSEKFNLENKIFLTESFVPTKKYGTALVGLCFVNYVFPVISKN